MSDFAKTMHNWRRMCDTFIDKYGADCGKHCPLYYLDTCGAIREVENGAYDNIAETVNTWAAENPEPVYPTWAELLIELGLAEHKTVFFNECCADGSYITTFDDVLSKAAYKPIRADIAEKLGLKPKRKENDV